MSRVPQPFIRRRTLPAERGGIQRCCPHSSFLRDLQEDETLGRNRRGRAPRCIVLAPTRELAQQVQREFQMAAPTLTCGAYYGGMPRTPGLPVAAVSPQPCALAQPLRQTLHLEGVSRNNSFSSRLAYIASPPTG